MGMLQGKIIHDTFVVIDVFALPVEGTETRVNAQAEAYEYMVDFADSNKVNLDTCMGIACISLSLSLSLTHTHSLPLSLSLSLSLSHYLTPCAKPYLKIDAWCAHVTMF